MDIDQMQRLRRLGARREKLQIELDAIVDEMGELIAELARAGVAPIELAKASTYTPGRVRVICREAGVPPLPTGRRPRRERAA